MAFIGISLTSSEVEFFSFIHSFKHIYDSPLICLIIPIGGKSLHLVTPSFLLYKMGAVTSPKVVVRLRCDFMNVQCGLQDWLRSRRPRAPGAAAQLGGGGGQPSPTGGGPAAAATTSGSRAASLPPHASPPHRARAQPALPQGPHEGTPNPEPSRGDEEPQPSLGVSSPPRGQCERLLLLPGPVPPRPFQAPLPAAREPDAGPQPENPGRIHIALISKPSGHTAPRLPAEAIEGRLAGCPVDRQLGVKVLEESRN